VVEEPLYRLVINIERSNCPYMSSIWVVVVCDPNDLILLGEGIPHAEKTSKCPSLPIYPQWDAQPSYIIVVQNN